MNGEPTAAIQGAQIWPPAGSLTPELIMAYDADQLPYEEWRALYLQEQ